MSKLVSSQTCNSCPGNTCEINCGQTLPSRSTCTREYFNFTISSQQDVTITVTPSSNAIYDLYVKWNGDCPSIDNWDCRPYLGMGLPQTCSHSNLPAGTYYIMVNCVISGNYVLSLNCGGTTTSTTTTTTTIPTSSITTSTTSTIGSTTISTTTTSLTTSTSTTSLTTSTSTSTSTTSTTPLISLQCQNDTIYVRQSNNCTVSGCQKGYFLVSNLEKHPLEKDILSDIPPNTVQFGPANETGKILTAAICLTPYAMQNHTTEVVKSPNLICPKICYISESCKCEVVECKNGVYLMDNFIGNPLETNVIKDINSTSFSYDFTSLEEGTIRTRMFCYEPYETKQEIYINITSPVIPTTIPGEFQISEILCSSNECMINVKKNTRDDVVTIFIYLIKEPEGTIYYSGKFTAMPGSIGAKITSLTSYRICTSGVGLKFLATVYPYSNLNNRIARTKGDAFVC